MGAVPQAFFLPINREPRFCLFHAVPDGAALRGALIYIHPFAEEMNLSRRMVAAQARVLAAAGFAVLQIDLFGCGDSAGDFEAASWDLWLDDVAQARAWLIDRVGDAPLWLWGLRSGCLLAAELAAQPAAAPARLLLWQPVLSGQQQLTQFLRLSLVADMTRGVQGPNTDQLMNRLAQGEAVEVAGYRVSPALANGLAKAKLERLGAGCTVSCVELCGTTEPRLSPALNTHLERWQASGCNASAVAVQGPAFWQQADAAACPALLAASLAAVSNLHPSGATRV